MNAERRIAVLVLVVGMSIAFPCQGESMWPPNIDDRYDKALQSDGKEVHLGAVRLPNRGSDLLLDGSAGLHGFAAVRFNSDGTLDTTFNGTGYAAVPIWGAYDRPTRILVESDDTILMVGNVAFPCGLSDPRQCDQYLAVVRLGRDGGVDASFNGDGKLIARIDCGTSPFNTYSAELEGDGNVLIWAWPRAVELLQFPVGLVHRDGTIDPSFQRGASTPRICNALAVESSPVIEFYSATLDHYFMTTDPAEFTALDNQVPKTWERTGWAFSAYPSEPAAPPNAQPVCRYYGNPASGLATHFFSAIPDECAVLAGRSEWVLESSNIFRVELPDTITGACPSGTTPVYRLWNRRADTNHRHTTSAALRDEMIAAGYVSEGYGRDGVAMCAPLP